MSGDKKKLYVFDDTPAMLSLEEARASGRAMRARIVAQELAKHFPWIVEGSTVADPGPEVTVPRLEAFYRVMRTKGERA